MNKNYHSHSLEERQVKNMNGNVKIIDNTLQVVSFQQVRMVMLLESMTPSLLVVM